MTKMEEASRTIRQSFTREELANKILEFITDMSFDKYECVDLLERVFGESAVNYETIADKIMTDDNDRKVELFASMG